MAIIRTMKPMTMMAMTIMAMPLTLRSLLLIVMVPTSLTSLNFPTSLTFLIPWTLGQFPFWGVY